MKLSLRKILNEGVFTSDPVTEYPEYTIYSVWQWLQSHPTFKKDMQEISNWAGADVRDGIASFLDMKMRENPLYFKRIEYNQFLNDLIKGELELTAQEYPGGPQIIIHKGKDKAPWRS